MAAHTLSPSPGGPSSITEVFSVGATWRNPPPPAPLGTTLGSMAVAALGADPPSLTQRFSYVANPWNAPVKPVQPGKRYGWSPSPWNPNGD